MKLEDNYVRTNWDELLQHVYEAHRKIKYWKLLCAIHESSFTEGGITENILLFSDTEHCCVDSVLLSCIFLVHLFCSCYFSLKTYVIPHINPDDKDRAGYETQLWHSWSHKNIVVHSFTLKAAYIICFNKCNVQHVFKYFLSLTCLL